jgi:translation initiation factor IF-2
MQTVASLAERLDMTAEEAVEKLRYMLFDVEGVDAVITDEEIDLLIDIDDDDDVAEKFRQNKLKQLEKDQKRNERLQKAAEKRRKEDAKKKADAEKAAAKKKKEEAAERKAKEKEEAPEAAAEPEVVQQPEVEAEAPAEDHIPLAEILPAVPEPEVQPAAEEHEPEPARAEILPPAPVVAEAAETTPEVPETVQPEAASAPAVVIGKAIEHEATPVLVKRADGTTLDTPEALVIEPEPEEAPEPEREERGALAEAERLQELEERRKSKAATTRPVVTPDPAVVAEVKRKAAERMERMQRNRRGEKAAPEPAQAIMPSPPREDAPPRRAQPSKATGKTARKRQKKAERMRAQDDLRREAAAAVREFQFGGPGARKKKRRRPGEDGDADAAEAPRNTLIEIEESITVEELANQMGFAVNDVILDLMDQNVLVTKNQVLDIEVVRKIADVHGFEVRSVIPEEDEVLADEPDDPADLVSRAPVITVMGHVDHGKTTFLDRIRSANVADGEAGGITQHIAAYDVVVGNGRVVFLDTPGHEAFTQMRARGAQATDVVVLVVAADDGVMPQTIEAIDHAKAAEVPIVVAVNKIDKPNAQPDRIRQELTKYELLCEEWGGKTIMKDISAKEGLGVDELLELLVLESELLELKANPKKRAKGLIIESEISRGQGPVAWVLVQNGTLRVGDIYLAGTTYGRVRSMVNARGESVEEVGPSTPVVVTGFSEPPAAGDHFVVVQEERIARAIASKRSDLERQKQERTKRKITLEDFHSLMVAGEQQELHVVLKADVQGSVDVFESSLSKQGNEEVSIRVVHSGVGGINESDVMLASASDAVIIGFHVTANSKVQKLAEQEGVDIRTYRVIYEAIDDVRKALEGMLRPEEHEVVTGHVEIRQVFRSSAIGNIAGCYVLDGSVTRNARVRLIRDSVVVHEGRVHTLRRAKDDAREVLTGFECGIKIDNFDDIREGDIIEVFKIEEVAKTLV